MAEVKQASMMGPDQVARLLWDVIQGSCVTHRHIRPEQLRDYGAPSDVVRAFFDIEDVYEAGFEAAAGNEPILASTNSKGVPMSDRALRAAVIRLAHDHPQFRKDLLPLVREAAEFPADSIGKEVSGPTGVPGSDAQKPWAKGEFTQQENAQLLEEQESGKLSDGKADTAKVASEDKGLRDRLIRLAHTHPQFRSDILGLLTE